MDKKRDFSQFKIKPITRLPISERSYDRWGYRPNIAVQKDFTIEEIEEIIRTGDLEALRRLSLYFYRTNSEYRNNIDFLAALPLYDNIIIPQFEEGKGSEKQIIKAFFNACDFLDRLDIPNTFGRITKEWLKLGVYNGILRKDGDLYTIQDLPLEYCRARFKDFNNLNILEFNVQYFDHIRDEDLRKESLLTFPEIVQKAYKDYKNPKNNRADPWVAIPAVIGGINFSFITDQTPLLIASIPELKKLKDAVGREEKRDENELYKLLIQKMPIDKDGELVFQLDEIEGIHAAVAQMLQDIDTVDVLTTFGDTALENIQDSSSASQSADRIEKYKNNAWTALGRGSILFNPEGSSSLAYAIKKDEALMISYLNVYATWIKFYVNFTYARRGVQFDFQFLPTTVFNRQDLQQSYFRGAQYGYSKMFAGVAMGIKQKDQISLMTFENDFLGMTEKMIPLQSSYTSSGNTSSNNNSTSTQKTTNTVNVQDLNNTGGRPELPDEQKSEKTQANIAAAG